MRVIAGSARGRRLAAVPGTTTRPITDRAKEALFSILGADVAGARVLDLFAGTGAVGIEALSRGAASCCFVERESAAVDTIRRNLVHTDLAPRGRVVRADVFAFLSGAPEPHDVVYVAPPQYLSLWRRTVELLDASPEWLAPGGVVVAQIHPREDEPLSLRSLAPADKRRYGSVSLLFFRSAPREESG